MKRKNRITPNQAKAKLAAIQRAFDGEMPSSSDTEEAAEHAFRQAMRAKIEAGRLRQFGVQVGNAAIVVAADELASAGGEVAGLAMHGTPPDAAILERGREALLRLPSLMA
jgi:hypothetical protein